MCTHQACVCVILPDSRWRAGRMVGWGMLLAAGLAAAQPVPGMQGAAGPVYLQVRRQAEALRKRGKYHEAVAACERFFQTHPEATNECRQLANLVDRILLRDLKQREKIVPVCESAFKRFENVPYYWAICASYLIQAKMWSPQRAEAADLAQKVVDKLGDNLPQGYVGAKLLTFHVYALRNAGRFGDAVNAAKNDAKLRPLLLSNDDFMQALSDAVKGAHQSDQLLSVAKLAFVLCDFTESSLNRATDLVTKALTATQGPGVAIQFAKAQEDAEAPNPLKDVPLFDLGDADKMLAAIPETELDARFNALLYAGNLADALDVAKRQLQQAAGVDWRLSAALKNLARCFKAHDLNLIRANKFLDFNRTGEGENPLPELEGELAHAAAP